MENINKAIDIHSFFIIFAGEHYKYSNENLKKPLFYIRVSVPITIDKETVLAIGLISCFHILYLPGALLL